MCTLFTFMRHTDQVMLPLIKQAAMTDDRGSQREPSLSPNMAVRPRCASWKASLHASCRSLRGKQRRNP